MTPDMGALRTLRGVISRVSSERLALARDTTEVVVSDGDMPSVLAARLLGCPSIAIGHGIVFSHGRPPAGVSAHLWRREARKARLASWGSTRQVAVNFMPIEAAEETVTIARPEVRSELRRAEPDGTVLAYFRDDNGEAVLRALVSAGERPLLFSDAPCAIEGVEVRPRDPKAFTAALCGARAVHKTLDPTTPGLQIKPEGAADQSKTDNPHRLLCRHCLGSSAAVMLLDGLRCTVSSGNSD